jgi:hypothetical protein
MEVIPVTDLLPVGKVLKNIADGFGLATATIIITATKNLYPHVHSNILQVLLKHVILPGFQKTREKVLQLL